MGIFLEVESLEVAMPSSCSYDAGAASGWWMLVVEISKQQKGDFLLVPLQTFLVSLYMGQQRLSWNRQCC